MEFPQKIGTDVWSSIPTLEYISINIESEILNK